MLACLLACSFPPPPPSPFPTQPLRLSARHSGRASPACALLSTSEALGEVGGATNSSPSPAVAGSSGSIPRPTLSLEMSWPEVLHRRMKRCEGSLGKCCLVRTESGSCILLPLPLTHGMTLDKAFPAASVGMFTWHGADEQAGAGGGRGWPGLGCSARRESLAVPARSLTP